MQHTDRTHANCNQNCKTAIKRVKKCNPIKIVKKNAIKLVKNIIAKPSNTKRKIDKQNRTTNTNRNPKTTKRKNEACKTHSQT